MTQPTHDEVKAWAQAIYDLRGRPPYTVLQIHPQAASDDTAQQQAAYQAEVELLSDFVQAWLPELRR